MSQTPRKPIVSPWTPSAGLAIAGLAGALALSAAPDDAASAAGVFPPWWGQARSLAAAQTAGAVLGVGAAPFVVIAASSTPNLPARLRAAGAWLVLDPGVAGGCAQL